MDEEKLKLVGLSLSIIKTIANAMLNVGGESINLVIYHTRITQGILLTPEGLKYDCVGTMFESVMAQRQMVNFEPVSGSVFQTVYNYFPNDFLQYVYTENQKPLGTPSV